MTISYIVGFLFSLIFTLLAYNLTLIHINSNHEQLPHTILIPILLAVAFIQLLVQLIFFLHFGRGRKPRWNVFFFVALFGGILVVIVGSMWIMYHLNYNMTPLQINKYIQDQSGF